MSAEQTGPAIPAELENACRVCGCYEGNECAGGCFICEPKMCSRCAEYIVDLTLFLNYSGPARGPRTTAMQRLAQLINETAKFKCHLNAETSGPALGFMPMASKLRH